MKRVFAISISFIFLTGTFVMVGGSFDRRFWLGFLPGLMGNLAILAVAIFVIDSIFKKERLDKLKQTNARQSKFVLFLTNRLAYLLLKHLALATEDEVGNDPELNFGFVHDRFRGTNLETIFYEKLMQSENKEAFTEAFAKILSRETEGISKALDKIYPRPDPTIKQIEDRMSFSIGSLGALKILLGAPKAVNAQVGPDEQLKPEHLDVLIRVVYGQIGLELKNIQNAIIHVSEKAGANKLFFCLD